MSTKSQSRKRRTRPNKDGRRANDSHVHRPRQLTAQEINEWRQRMERIAAGHRQHYWGTL